MSQIYDKLQFNNLQTISSLSNSKLQQEISPLGIDKIHFSGEFPTVFFKEVESFNEKSLKEIAKVQHKLWNYKKVLLLYVTSLTEIRIYNCSATPFNYEHEMFKIDDELKKSELIQSKLSDKVKLKKITEIFSAAAIDSGSIWTIKNEYLNKIELNKRIDKFLVNSLILTANQLVKDGLDLDVVHSLIMRSLFIMYLEDKGATTEELYKTNDLSVTTYFDLLDNIDATYNFFQKIQDNFNGNVFPVTKMERDQVHLTHLNLIKKCLTNGDIKNETLFTDWRIFKFDIIQIELLSEIYENFLSKIDKELTGSYYTPPALVELILNNVLPVENETNYALKILDPTCGSGIFLVEAYKRIVQRWQNAHLNETLNFKILKTLMQNSIYGIELNKKSVKVATFSLYLCLLDFLNPKNLWYLNGEKFPYLINDIDDPSLETQGFNLFRTDTIKKNTSFMKKYDLIIGNPPYGKKSIPNNIKDYCIKYGFSQEFVIPFIHKSTILAPKGKIALVVPTKLLTNTAGTSQKFRSWLFNENYVEKVYNLSILRKTPKEFGGQLFSSAVGPATILFFQKEQPAKTSNTIEYWAPKTYIKENIAEGVLIDSSDIKYLPREECQIPDTKIWKIAQWGSLNDFNLLKKLFHKKSFLTFLDENKIDKGVGFQPIGKSQTEIRISNKIPKLGFIDAKDINRFYTNKDEKKDINSCIKSIEAKNFYTKYYNNDIFNLPPINAFRRFGNINTFKTNHVLIKEGFSNNRFCATYLDYECAFTSTILGLRGDNTDILKLITCYLNSSFSVYFLFLTSSSWGIERERVKPNELYLLPFINKEINIKIIVQIYNKIQSKINNNYPLKVNYDNLEKELDEIFFDSFNILEYERIFINDTIKYAIDLFHKGHNSIAVKPIDNTEPETLLYANMLCKEVNQTLEDTDLKLITRIYKASHYTPLNLVIFRFVPKDNNDIKNSQIIKSDTEFNNYLIKLNKFTLTKYSKSIYIQKQISYYDNDEILIIKPNQKRFWTESQAIEDAQNINIDIMSMSV